jgi:hypothetical protein
VVGLDTKSTQAQLKQIITATRSDSISSAKDEKAAILGQACCMAKWKRQNNLETNLKTPWQPIEE